MNSDTFSLRVSLVYIALFVVIGIHLPFFPVWLKAQGLNDGQIALVLAGQIATRIVSTPVFTFRADKRRAHRSMLISLCLGVTLLVTALAFAQGFLIILILSLAGMFIWAPIMPMIESYAVREAGLRGLDYGRMRLWGSLSFIAAGAAGGLLLDYFTPTSIMISLIAGHGLLTLAALLLPRSQTKETGQVDGAAPKELRISDATRLLATPVFVTFMLAAGLSQTSHAVLYTFGTLNWQHIGIPGGIIGLLWGTGVIAEVVLFAFSKRAVALFTPAGLILLGALAGVVRWALTAHNPPLAFLFCLQVLHALTFAASHLGALHFLNRAVPRHLHATAQGVYQALGVSVLMSIATLLSGGLYERYGSYAYYAAALISFCSALAAIQLLRSWDGGQIPVTPKAPQERDA
ncbi:MAG: MFS transporter [Hyphomicrobiales bacterium]